MTNEALRHQTLQGTVTMMGMMYDAEPALSHAWDIVSSNALSITQSVVDRGIDMPPCKGVHLHFFILLISNSVSLNKWVTCDKRAYQNFEEGI
jgi:hypothetical protein